MDKILEIKFEKWNLGDKEKIMKNKEAHLKFLNLVYLIGFEWILY